MARTSLAKLLVLAALLLPACGDDGAPDLADGGVDAALPADAGSDPADAGPDPTDAGGDAGHTSEDAGHASEDAGQDAPDAYVPPVDTDCDGLIDGPSREGWLGEDLDGDGVVDEGETDPTLFDTDGDGLSDGVERGITEPFDPVGCAGVFVADGDPTTTTDPTLVDTDGDGIEDGVEDENRDGVLDPGELDPTDAASPGALAGVCAPGARAELAIASAGPDLALALPTTAATIEVQDAGAVIGAMAYDAPTGVALLALRVTRAEGFADADAVERALRPALESVGALSDPVAQRTRTWDGTPGLFAAYEQAGSLDPDHRAAALGDALAPGSTGRLPAVGGTAGPAQLRALYVLRGATEAIALVSIAPLAASSAATRVAEDFVAGASLARARDSLAPTCRRLEPLATPKLDLLFVVDDSGSMASSQQALATSARTMLAALDRAGIDWRIALVTTSYALGGRANTGRVRGFTRNPNLVQAWLTQNSVCVSGTCTGVPTAPEPATCPGGTSQGANGGCWVGLSGSGTEGILGAARTAVTDLAPGTEAGAEESPSQLRADAHTVIVLLGDADDQTTGPTTTSGNCGPGGSLDVAGAACTPVADFVRFFTAVDGVPPENAIGASIPVHGIVCPPGAACGCTSGSCDLANGSREFNPQPIDGVPQQRHAAVVHATGGVLGSIRDAASIARVIEAITRDTIARVGHPLASPAAGGSLRVALSAVEDPLACGASDLPWSELDGHRYDAHHRSVSWFGACRPATETEHAVVSFQRWLP